VHYKLDIITIYVSSTAYMWLQQTKDFVNRTSRNSHDIKSSVPKYVRRTCALQCLPTQAAHG